jgi:hypothetical protein
MKKITLLVTFALSSASFAGIDSAWEGFSAPEILLSGFSSQFSSLPLDGQINQGTTGWSSSYWPSKKGGIANRWNSPGKETFDYISPKKDVVAKMSLEQLKLLSPAEKYDLLLGDYNYGFKHEVYSSTDPHAKDWAGICHGWSPAAMNHNEPTPKTLVNPDGIAIPFGTADIKGLLSYYYAFNTEDEATNQVGLRCFFGSWLGGAKGCGDDLNAGAFHIIIANKLGIQHEGFLADVDRFNEIWNQPVFGFKSQIVDANLAPSKKAAKSAVREIRIQTEFFYVDESDLTWTPVIGTPGEKISKLDLTYRIELDYAGNIVGGIWESKARPDFLWSKAKAKHFDGVLSRLPELLND